MTSTQTELYSIRCWNNRYAGKWVVIRNRDGKVMTEDYSVRTCLRWVNVWGPMYQ